MATRQLRKSEKQEAIEKIVRLKYKGQYEKLIARGRELVHQIYDETLGVTGHQLADVAKGRVGYWLDTKAALKLDDFPRPELMVLKPKGRAGCSYVDLFTGSDSHWGAHDEWRITLHSSVVWPDRNYSDAVPTDEAKAGTKKKLDTLERHVRAFNKDVREYYDWVSGIVLSLRTAKQVDNHFPELWHYLPEGTRQELKQAMIPFDQRDFDQLRKTLPKGK